VILYQSKGLHKKVEKILQNVSQPRVGAPIIIKNLIIIKADPKMLTSVNTVPKTGGPPTETGDATPFQSTLPCNINSRTTLTLALGRRPLE